jgi:hypothetical protein
MNRVITLLSFLALFGCASPNHGALSVEEVTSVLSAEAFVERNGYTLSGHPPGAPVQNVEVLDLLATREELIRWRAGTLERKAFAIVNVASHTYYVLFRRVGNPDQYRGVLVQNTAAVQVVHSVLTYTKDHWKPVVVSK